MKLVKSLLLFLLSLFFLFLLFNGMPVQFKEHVRVFLQHFVHYSHLSNNFFQYFRINVLWSIFIVVIDILAQRYKHIQAFPDRDYLIQQLFVFPYFLRLGPKLKLEIINLCKDVNDDNNNALEKLTMELLVLKGSSGMLLELDKHASKKEK